MRSELGEDEVTDQARERGGSWQVILWILVGLAIIGLVILIVWSDLYYQWTRKSWYPDPFTPEQVAASQKSTWDWLDLLVVPAVIAVSALIYGSLERRNEQNIAEKRRKEDREIAEKQLAEDRRIAEQQLAEDRKVADERAQDATLQAYLEQMSELLIDKELRKSTQDDEEQAEKRAVARAWTLTVLRRLKGERKGLLLRFLYESGLIMKENNIVYLEGADLGGAELGGAYLAGAYLIGAYLAGARLREAKLGKANLAEADLAGADLDSADLDSADLGGADLAGANLTGAYLGGANLAEAKLGSAKLGGADLVGANLIGAKLGGADLGSASLGGAILAGANLSEANLTGAYLGGADLAGANLEGANLEGAYLSEAKLGNAKYNGGTKWPKGFKPEEAGALFVKEEDK